MQEQKQKHSTQVAKPSSWLFSLLKKPQILLSLRSPGEVKTPGSSHTVYSYTTSSGKPDGNFSFSFYVQCCCWSCQKTWHFDLYMRKQMHRHFIGFTQSHQENQYQRKNLSSGAPISPSWVHSRGNLWRDKHTFPMTNRRFHTFVEGNQCPIFL